jgi:hypothetical protein
VFKLQHEKWERSFPIVLSFFALKKKKKKRKKSQEPHVEGRIIDV